jgi:protein gp37
MSVTTGIEWTDSTWNPIRGCSRVSEGCRNCYAESMALRFSGPGQPYEGLAVLQNGHALWTGKIQFVEKHLLDPLKWRAGIRDQGTGSSRPRRIFVNSMSDLFHENVTDEMRDRIFAVMALCPQHTFQVLTKRPERMLEYFATGLLGTVREAFVGRQAQMVNQARTGLPVLKWSGLPLPNAWLGVSVENQATADARIPMLLKTPAAVRFISAEPLLGPVNLKVTAAASCVMDCLNRHDGLDWVICGGESGPHARPMNPDWARGLRDQCQAAGVPFFFKQWGEWAPGRGPDPKKEIPIHAHPQGLMHRAGKKAAGSLLDGVEHKAFPVPCSLLPVPCTLESH